MIAVGVKKANPDVKAAIERLQKEPENNGKNHPIPEAVNDEKKYPKRERKIPAYLREMEIGPALFTPDNLKSKGQKDDNKLKHTGKFVFVFFFLEFGVFFYSKSKCFRALTQCTCVLKLN